MWKSCRDGPTVFEVEANGSPWAIELSSLPKPSAHEKWLLASIFSIVHHYIASSFLYLDHSKVRYGTGLEKFRLTEEGFKIVWRLPVEPMATKCRYEVLFSLFLLQAR